MPAPSALPKTLYDKIWDEHVVDVQDDGLTLLYADRHLVHEVASNFAFEGLRNTGRTVRRRDCTLATIDHNVPTDLRGNFSTLEEYIADPESRAQCMTLEQNAKEYGLTLFGVKDQQQGIVHIIGPEQGFTLPGSVIVCGDSHTSTHGAFGALAFGIGTSELEHVLATQTVLQKKSKNMRVTVDGTLQEGVTAKDVILHIIGIIGTAGGTGCVIEYAGSVFRDFSMEARMSVCNMSIEAGARAGMVAPDETTFEYLKGRPLSPKGELWDQAIAYWQTLKTDEGADFDKEVHIKAEDIVPTVTWGNSPQDVAPITGSVPDPSTITDPVKRESMERALRYMGLTPNTPMKNINLDKVFIGSCTNSRIEDLRSAAKIVLAAGPEARVASHVHAMVVPGSGLIKQQAETEGLDIIFKRAGFDWREAGCSMCIGMNPDKLKPKERCASTSNRNFQGRQGPGGRTHLVSPAMAAAAALAGHFVDVRSLNVAQTDKAKNKSAARPSILSEEFASMPEPQPTAQNTDSSSSFNGSGSTDKKRFTVLKGVAARLDIENVDTDLIIPNRFLKRMKREGLKDGLFYALRKDLDTGHDTDFILNRPPFDNAKILICTGQNFGCGSSREAAPWSLKDFGIRCVIAPSFGEIFYNNTLQNGMLAIMQPTDVCMMLANESGAGSEFEVDLDKGEIRRPGGEPPINFGVDPSRRHCLLNGLDDIALTLQKTNLIEAFENRRSIVRPWLDGIEYSQRKKVLLSNSDNSTKALEW